MPESPKFLFSIGKNEKSKNSLNKIAHVNKRKKIQVPLTPQFIFVPEDRDQSSNTNTDSNANEEGTETRNFWKDKTAIRNLIPFLLIWFNIVFVF